MLCDLLRNEIITEFANKEQRNETETFTTGSLFVRRVPPDHGDMSN